MIKVTWKNDLNEKEAKITYFNCMRKFGKWNTKEKRIIDVKKVKKIGE